MRRRFPLALRLFTILSTVAATAAALALAAQDRGLRADLHQAARARLARSVRSADHLVAATLIDFTLRQESVSRTPEFRAHLELGHPRTLEQFAAELAERTRARAVLFLGTRNEEVAGVGPASARRRLASRWTSALPEARGCVAPAGEGDPAAEAWSRCQPGTERLQGSLVWIDGETWITAAAPLRRGERRLGLLVAGQPVSPALLDRWSDLAGATIVAHSEPAAPTTPLHKRIRRFGDFGLHVESDFVPEGEVLGRARRNLLGAGVLAIALSAILSTLLARSFVRPIRQIQRATERIGDGDFDVRLSIRRSDEIGEVASVFDATLERLRESQDRLLRVQRLARFGDWSFDPTTGLTQGSPEFRRLLGLPVSSGPVPIGSVIGAFDACDRGRLEEALSACAEGEQSLRLELVRTVSGQKQVLELRGHLLRTGGDPRIEASIHDVSDRRRSEEQIRFLAYRDSLTGLGNRRLLRERLELAVARPAAEPFAVIFVDLDRFKLVNDTLGHAAGDELLRNVGARLLAVTEDDESAVTARIGGDEFTLLVPDAGDGVRATAKARTILERLGEPILIDGQEVIVNGTLGIALWPRHGPTADDLIRGCDTALHRAKVEGRNTFRVFDVAMQDAARRRWQLETRLRRAIACDLLALHYQPRVDARTGRIVGFEALARWTDSELGAVPPSTFVSVAEETGLILPLGDWVLRSAMDQARKWSAEGLSVGKISINLSGRQLRPTLVGFVRDLCGGTDADSLPIEFEVTESAVMDDEEVGVLVLSELRAMGFLVSLDDFGTGFSSLSMLQRMPIDAVKIDRTFVRNVASDPRDAELAASIMAMARILGLHVVVEGVETEGQRDVLREMGCDEMQGFLFGDSVPAEAVAGLLRERRRRKRRDRPSASR